MKKTASLTSLRYSLAAFALSGQTPDSIAIFRDFPNRLRAQNENLQRGGRPSHAGPLSRNTLKCFSASSGLGTFKKLIPVPLSTCAMLAGSKRPHGLL